MKRSDSRTAGVGLILLGILLLGYGMYLAITPNIYQSTVRIKVEKEWPDFGGLADPTLDYDPYWIQTEFEKIQSKSILYPVITNLNLNRGWAEKRKMDRDLRMEKSYAILKKRLDISLVRGTAFFDIAVKSEDRQEAAVIANAIAEQYCRDRLAVKRDLVLRGISTYTKEIEKQTQKIAALEAQGVPLTSDSTATDTAQRDLSTMNAMKERLQKRLEQEMASLKNLKLNTEIIDRAEPALNPIYPNKIKTVAAIFLGTVLVILGVVVLKQPSSGS